MYIVVAVVGLASFYTASGARLANSTRSVAAVEVHDGHSPRHPRWMYKNDCWKKRPLALVQQARQEFEEHLASQEAIPGAGMNPDEITPFQTVLKDGFFKAACVKDHMLYYGDKFGKHKFDYSEGAVSNTSIVRYDELVKKQDREPMSPDVCFSFCRTVPNMTFFGIQNGRNCYCVPFFKPMAGDSSQCDANCEGDTSQLCGSKTKSTLWEMHMCANTVKDLEYSLQLAKNNFMFMRAGGMQLEQVEEGIQKSAEGLQMLFGEMMGDTVASNLMQEAKVWAGNMSAAIKQAQDFGDKFDESIKAAEEILSTAKGGLDFETTTAAEDVMEKLGDETHIAEQHAFKIRDMMLGTMPDMQNKTEDVEDQFYKVMYFVNKKHDGLPTTCGGDLSTHVLGGTMEGCAQACALGEGHEDCVGFNYMPNPITGGVCFLFSKLDSVMYYTGCDKKVEKNGTNSTAGRKSAFLAKEVSESSRYTPEEYQCYVKFSRFDGTTLEPDPSGKCKQCLTSATKNAKCLPV
jgi:hypothetical protein